MIDCDISVVVPTHNRETEVYDKCQLLLADNLVRELIVVIDGSTDKTLTRLQTIDDPRLRLIVNKETGGPSRARNTGMKYASCPWIALLDDDDHHSDGFLHNLVNVAQESKATVVGAPWLHLAAGVSPQVGFEEAERSQNGPNVSSPSIVPEVIWAVNPWIPLNVVINRANLGEVRFNEGYLGNFWREETDFFVTVARSGGKVVATNRAYSFQYIKPPGGIDRSKRFLYEFWVARNEIRFMLRHGRWLRQHGHIESVVGFLRSSMVSRCRPRLDSLLKRLRKAGRVVK